MWRCCGSVVQRRVAQGTWQALRPLGISCARMSTSGTTTAPPTTPTPQPPSQQQQQQTSAAPHVATTTQPPPAAALTMDELLHELQCIITRPMLMGELFRRLSAPGRRALVQSKMPLEELLLHYPKHFAVYRSKRKPQHSLHVAPPHCVPYQSHVLTLVQADTMAHVPGAENLLATMKGNQTPRSSAIVQAASSPVTATPAAATGSDAKQADSLTSTSLEVAVDFMTPRERLQIVLKYIPNEFTPFVDLAIPHWVKTKCMQYPFLPPSKYFAKYPQYFDVRAQSAGGHTFAVRRSLALQERIRMHTAGS